MAETQTRSRKMQVAVRPDVYERIVKAADEVGLSVNAWAAYTLGQAAYSALMLREKMTDSMAAMLKVAVQEGLAESEPDEKS